MQELGRLADCNQETAVVPVGLFADCSRDTAFHTAAAGAELQAAADLELLDIQAVEDTADKSGLQSDLAAEILGKAVEVELLVDELRRRRQCYPECWTVLLLEHWEVQ